MIPSNRFFVTHTTSSFNLESILKSRSIQPLALRKKLYEEEYKEEINYESMSDFYEQAKDKEKYTIKIFKNRQKKNGQEKKNCF